MADPTAPPEEGATGLDATATFLDGIDDNDPKADAYVALFAMKIAKMAKGEMATEGDPTADGPKLGPDGKPVPDGMMMKADAEKRIAAERLRVAAEKTRADSEAAKATAAQARADKAEAELRKVALARIRTDAADAGLTVGGLDKADPTDTDIATAQAALSTAALAKVRADAAKGRTDGQRRNPLDIPPTGPGRADANDKKPIDLPRGW